VTASDIRNIIKTVVEAHVTHNNWYSIWSVAKDRESELTYPAVIWGQWTGRLDENPGEISGALYLNQLCRLLIITDVGTNRTPEQRDQAVEDANNAATDIILSLRATYAERIGNVVISTQFDGYGALETGVLLSFTFKSDALCLDGDEFNPPEDCPTFAELIALLEWAGIKADMSVGQIADATADLCTGGGPCEDATVLINGTEVDTIASGGSLDIPVLQDGSPVGSLVGSEWIVPPCGGDCPYDGIIQINGVPVDTFGPFDPCDNNTLTININ